MFLPFVERARRTNRATRGALTASLAAAAIGGLLGAANDGGHVQTIVGESKPLGAGTMTSWLRTAADGAPAAMGVSFDDAALTGLATDGGEIVLALPPVTGSTARNVVVDWNPHGHPPAHVYDVPHFDFHIYTIDETARMAVTAEGAGSDRLPAPDLVPAGFVGGNPVPMMGRHYVSAAQPEFHHGTFTATPICGYVGGHLAFFESMISLAYLQTHPALVQPFPQPARFEENGWFPALYGVSYDRTAHRYEVTFTK